MRMRRGSGGGRWILVRVCSVDVDEWWMGNRKWERGNKGGVIYEGVRCGKTQLLYFGFNIEKENSNENFMSEPPSAFL